MKSFELEFSLDGLNKLTDFIEEKRAEIEGREGIEVEENRKIGKILFSEEFCKIGRVESSLLDEEDKRMVYEILGITSYLMDRDYLKKEKTEEENTEKTEKENTEKTEEKEEKEEKEKTEDEKAEEMEMKRAKNFVRISEVVNSIFNSKMSPTYLFFKKTYSYLNTNLIVYRLETQKSLKNILQIFQEEERKKTFQEYSKMEMERITESDLLSISDLYTKRIGNKLLIEYGLRLFSSKQDEINRVIEGGITNLEENDLKIVQSMILERERIKQEIDIFFFWATLTRVLEENRISTVRLSSKNIKKKLDKACSKLYKVYSEDKKEIGRRYLKAFDKYKLMMTRIYVLNYNKQKISDKLNSEINSVFSNFLISKEILNENKSLNALINIETDEKIAEKIKQLEPAQIRYIEGRIREIEKEEVKEIRKVPISKRLKVVGTILLLIVLIVGTILTIR